ncbi:MAG: hypothetical protein GY773_12935, partial [Actinomycetia bacterium]|nr:hypothetical protein [Actinomycetes bacterium]
VNTDGGDLAAILAVVAIDQVESGGITPDLYAANIVASAAGAEIHPITLPGGIEVVGWEEPDQELIFLVWIGRRIVVLATGPLAAADVLALYGDLVPAP